MTVHLSQRGMTLIEVLVAMALLSLLSVGILSTFRAGQRVYGQVTRVDTALSDVVRAQRFLRRVLESAYPFEGTPGASWRAYGLEGGRDTLGLTAPMPLAAETGGYYRYEIALIAGAADSKNLVVRSRLDRNGLPLRTAAGDHEEILIERVQAIELAYLDPEDSQWRTEWSEKRKLPTLVRLRVMFPPGDPRRWPDLVVMTRVTNDANCGFDAISQACREGPA